jgi:hypothetical protein
MSTPPIKIGIRGFLAIMVTREIYINSIAIRNGASSETGEMLR